MSDLNLLLSSMALILNLAAIVNKHSYDVTQSTYVVKLDDSNEARETREECAMQSMEKCQTPCQWRISSQNKGFCHRAADITTVAKNSRFQIGEHILVVEDILEFPNINFKVIVFKGIRDGSLYVIIPAAGDRLYAKNPKILFELEADIRMYVPGSGWPEVLRGLYRIYQRISGKMMEYLQSRKEDVVVGGFSLGGSLSRFLTYDLCRTSNHTQRKISCLVAGEKRTGGMDWCHWWKTQRVCQHYSVLTGTSSGADPVCISPMYSITDTPAVPISPLATITPCLVLSEEGKVRDYQTENIELAKYPTGQSCFDLLRSDPRYTKYLAEIWPVLSQSLCGVFSPDIRQRRKTLHNLKGYQDRLNLVLKISQQAGQACLPGKRAHESPIREDGTTTKMARFGFGSKNNELFHLTIEK